MMWFDFGKIIETMKLIDKCTVNTSYPFPSRSRRIKNKRRNKKGNERRNYKMPEISKDYIKKNKKLIQKYPFLQTKDCIKKNKELIQKYPFLQTKDFQGNKTFECTWLDFMPEGWKQCFGELLCEDILKVLQKSSISLEDFTILDIKEKFGTLRVYWTGSNELECELEDIINKYEYLSKYTCVLCGKVNVPIYGGWISPYCNECASKVYPKPYKNHQIEDAHLQNTFTKTVYRSSDATKKDVILDISDIIERIDKKFKGDFHE